MRAQNQRSIKNRRAGGFPSGTRRGRLSSLIAALLAAAAVLVPCAFTATGSGKLIPASELICGEDDSAVFHLEPEELLDFLRSGEGESAGSGSSASGPGTRCTGTAASGSSAAGLRGTHAASGTSVASGASVASGSGAVCRSDAVSGAGAASGAGVASRTSAAPRASAASASSGRPSGRYLSIEEDSGAPVRLYVIPRRQSVRFLFENSGDQPLYCAAVLRDYATEPVLAEPADESGRVTAVYTDLDLQALTALLEEMLGATGDDREEAPEPLTPTEPAPALAFASGLLSGQSAKTEKALLQLPVLKAQGGVSWARNLADQSFALVFQGRDGILCSVQIAENGSLYPLPVEYTETGKVRSLDPESGDPELWTFQSVYAPDGVYQIVSSIGTALRFGSQSAMQQQNPFHVAASGEGDVAIYSPGSGFLKGNDSTRYGIGYMGRTMQIKDIPGYLESSGTGLWFSLAEVEAQGGGYGDDRIRTVEAAELNAAVRLYDYDERVNTRDFREQYGFRNDDFLFYNHKWDENGQGSSSVDGAGMLEASGGPANMLGGLGYGFPQTVYGGDLGAFFGSEFLVGEDLKGGGLFQQDEDGYYWYDSAKNAAYFDGEKFVLYDCAIRPNYYNQANQSLWCGEGREDERSGNFFPFNPLTEPREGQPGSVVFRDRRMLNGGVPSYLLANGTSPETGQVDLWFGMNVEFRFVVPKDGKVNGKDMIFDFWGDDDVYVYVDDALVMDIGGCHWACGGTINFSETVRRTNSAISYMRMDPDAEEAYKSFSRISDCLEQGGEGMGIFPEGYFDEGTVHTLRFYYMERGGDISYCRLRFNMPTLPPEGFALEKQLSAGSGAILTEEDQDREFLFRVVDEMGRSVLDDSTLCSVVSTLQRLEPDEEGIIRLKGGERAVFSGPFHAEDIFIEELLPEEDAGWSVETAAQVMQEQSSWFPAIEDSYRDRGGRLYRVCRAPIPLRPSADEDLPAAIFLNRKEAPLRRMPDTGAPPAAAWGTAAAALFCFAFSALLRRKDHI